ncbi:hypothetical protein Tco_0581087 [Tanacetum coccineum]
MTTPAITETSSILKEKTDVAQQTGTPTLAVSESTHKQSHKEKTDVIAQQTGTPTLAVSESTHKQPHKEPASEDMTTKKTSKRPLFQDDPKDQKKTKME